MINQKRNFGLDIIRSLSILLVLLAHRFTLYYEYGIVGVQFFFVLSGFLIGQILIKDFYQKGCVKVVLHFLKRRWFRILPLYYFLLTLKILFYGNPFGWKIIVYYLFLQANILGVGFWGITWSLVVEEWFYLLLPISMLVFFKNGIKKHNLLVFLILGIFSCLILRFCWNYFGCGNIVYQFDCLLLGVFLAYLKIFFFQAYSKLSSILFFIIGVIGVASFTVILGDISSVDLFDSFYRVIWYFLISIFISFIIPFVEQSNFINYTLKGVGALYYFFTWTSILTYSIYLVHTEIFRIYFENISDTFLVCIHFFILYLVCFCIYFLFEHPMLNLRDDFSIRNFIGTIKKSSFRL